MHKRKYNFTAKTLTEQLGLQALLASSSPIQWLKTPSPRTEESSLPYWAQSPGKEKTESEDLERGWGPRVGSREQRNRRGLSTCQVSITHHLAIAGHPGLDRPNHSVTSQAAVTQQLFPHPKQFKRRVRPPKIHPLSKGLGVSVNGQYWWGN